MAAAMALLLILPVLAAEGQRFDREPGPQELRVGVFDSGDTPVLAVAEGSGSPDATVDTDDSISLSNTRDTRVGRDLYVSNDPEAYDKVVVAVLDTSVVLGMNPINALVEVENTSTRESITDGLTLTEVGGANNAGLFTTEFTVVGPTATPSTGEIQANDGDTIQVTHGDRVVELTVDGEGPTFSNITPDHGTIVDNPRRIDITFIVTDEGSGLREDSEDFDQTDAEEESDIDDDGDREPLASTDYGSSADIALFWASGADTSFTAANNDDDARDRDSDIDWNEIDAGVEYEGDARIRETDSGVYGWLLWARDRAGNVGTTDRDSDETGFQNRTVEIDDLAPQTAEIRAGVGFDESKNREKTDRFSVAITFTNGDSGVEKLDSSSIDVEQFRVDMHDVVDFIHPNKAMNEDDQGDCVTSTDIEGNCVDTRNRVYLILDTPLEGDEEPRVQVFGGSIVDIAGNDNESSDSEDSDAAQVQDRIAPTFTVFVEGDVRDADGRPLTTDEFDVSISTDERISGRPQLTLATIAPAAEDNEWEIGSIDTNVTLRTEGTFEWSAEFDASDLSAGLVAVIVSGSDRAGAGNNFGRTDGWDGDGDHPAVGDALDLLALDEAGLLVEFDDTIGVASVELSPLKDGETEVTESRNAFVKITFDENAEYDVDSEDELVALDGEDEVDVDVDSYEMVTITSIELDGENIRLDGSDQRAALSRVNGYTFNLSLAGLELGEHEIVFTAEDVAGNEDVDGADDEEYEFSFEVVRRSAYKVSLTPGWNLISLPGDPEDPSIGAVFPNNAVTDVLAFQNGQWVVAGRIEGQGAWGGELTDIQAGYGYLVHTNRFVSVETQIRELSIQASPPTIPIVAGWNLIGVVDIDQAKAGSAPGAGAGGAVDSGDADNYFSGLNWTSAYKYDTTTSRWTKIVPESDGGDEITNGSGYWLWAQRAGTLVP